MPDRKQHIERLHRVASVATKMVEVAYQRRRRAATVALGLLAILLGYHVVFGHNGLTAFMKKRDEAKGLEKQMEMLTADNDRLRDHVDRLRSDPNAIEHEARENLHYTRNDEVIYTLPADPQQK